MPHDFEIIPEGTSVATRFVISYGSKEYLNIRQTKSTCGCTASKPKKSNLKPGESGRIEVAFDATVRNGKQNKAIFVFTNDHSNPTQIVRI